MLSTVYAVFGAKLGVLGRDGGAGAAFSIVYANSSMRGAR